MFPFAVSASILFIPAFVLHDFCFSFSLLLCLLALMGFDIVFEQKMSLFLVAYTHNNTYNSGIDHLYIVPLAMVVIGCGENTPIRTINWPTTLTGGQHRHQSRTATNQTNKQTEIITTILNSAYSARHTKLLHHQMQNKSAIDFFFLRARPICY